MSDVRVEMADYLRSVKDEDHGLQVWAFTEIGSGGSHVVYERSSSDSFVVKVPHDYLQPPDPSRAGGADHRLRLERKVEAITEAYQQLYRHFGLEWCIPQQAFVVPIQLAPETAPSTGYAFLQRKEPAFGRPDLVRIDTPYFELQLDEGRIDRAAYRRMNVTLLGTAEPDVSDYIALNPHIPPCMELIERDPSFRDLIRAFLQKFKGYVEQVDEIIDLVGQYNVFAFADHGEWTMRIGSVIKGQRHSDLPTSPAMLQRVGGDGPVLSRQERLLLLNGVAVYRLVNALAVRAGMGRLMDLRLEADQLEAISTIRADGA
jgi:hypothetical protein